MGFERDLISAVREEPILFNKGMRSYRNVHLKARAWKRISQKINIAEVKCQRRWKTLRDQFVRERNFRDSPSGSGEVWRKQWKYYNLMGFLAGHIGKHSALKSAIEEYKELEEEQEDPLGANSIVTIKNDSLENSEPLPELTFVDSAPLTPTAKGKLVSCKDFSENVDTPEAESQETIFFQYLTKYVRSKNLTIDEFMALQIKLSEFTLNEIKRIKDE